MMAAGGVKDCVKSKEKNIPETLSLVETKYECKEEEMSRAVNILSKASGVS